MIKDNILWSRVIEPMNGKLVKEPTFLGATLIVTVGTLFFALVLYGILWTIPILSA